MSEIKSFHQLGEEWERVQRRKCLYQILRFEKELEELDPEEDAERISQLEDWIKELMKEV